MRHSATLDVTNSSLEIVILIAKEMLGKSDLRSIGYYKIKHGVLQQNLSKYFRFESPDAFWEWYDEIVNT